MLMANEQPARYEPSVPNHGQERKSRNAYTYYLGYMFSPISTKNVDVVYTSKLPSEKRKGAPRCDMKVRGISRAHLGSSHKLGSSTDHSLLKSI